MDRNFFPFWRRPLFARRLWVQESRQKISKQLLRTFQKYTFPIKFYSIFSNIQTLAVFIYYWIFKSALPNIFRRPAKYSNYHLQKVWGRQKIKAEKLQRNSCVPKQPGSKHIGYIQLCQFPDVYIYPSKPIIFKPNIAHLVGSSKNMIGGLLIISKAIDNLFLCPPERLLALVFLASCKPNVSNMSSTWCVNNIKFSGQQK